MGVAQTGSRSEARHLAGHFHLRCPALIRPRYYFHEPRYGLHIVKVYEGDRTGN